MPATRPPLGIVLLLLAGLAVTYGGFSVLQDQRSGKTLDVRPRARPA